MTDKHESNGAATVTRLHQAESLQDDRYQIADGDQAVTVDYEHARRFWLGRLSFTDLLELRA